MSKKKNSRTSKREASGAGGSSFIPSGAALRRARVLVVGDVMLDRYWFGDVEPHLARGAGAGREVQAQRGAPGRRGQRRAQCRSARRARRRCCRSSATTSRAHRLSELLRDEEITARLHRDRTIDTTVKLRVIGRASSSCCASISRTEPEPRSAALQARRLHEARSRDAMR